MPCKNLSSPALGLAPFFSASHPPRHTAQAKACDTGQEWAVVRKKRREDVSADGAPRFRFSSRK